MAGEYKVWRDIWSAGQAIGAAAEVMPTRDYVDRLAREYRDALDVLLNQGVGQHVFAESLRQER